MASDRQDADAGMLRHLVRQDHVGAIANERVLERFGSVDDDLKGDAWMLPLIGRDGVRQEAGRDRLGHCHAYDPAQLAAQLLDIRLYLSQVLERASHVSQQHLTGRGQPDASGQALEQRHADLLLEVENATIQRRRGHTQRIGGFANRAVSGDCVEVQVIVGRLETGLPHPRTTWPKHDHVAAVSVIL